MPLRPHGWWFPAAAVLLLWNGVSYPALFDTGELVAAAWRLEGSHAPGQPLHALAGHLAALVPLGPIPWRITAVSAGAAVAAAWLAGRLAGGLLEQLTDHRGPWVRAAPDAVALGTLLALPVLRQATRPEVYAPALALTAGAFLLSWRWAVRGPHSGAGLRQAALLAGLTTALHPPHALAIFAVALLLALVLRAEVFRRPRTVAWTVAFGLLGLGVHAYLPVRAMAGASMWGDPTTPGGFLAYVSGQAYRANLAGDAVSMGGILGGVLPHLAASAGWVAVAGLALLVGRHVRLAGRRRWAIAATLAPLAAVGAALLQPLEVRNPDNVAYLGPALVWLMAAGGAGIACLAVLSRWGRVAAAVGILSLALHPASLHAAPSVLRADSPALETWGALLTHTPPPRALVVVETDAAATAWWGARATEGARPDVAPFATGLATSSWHWRALGSHPAFDGQPVRGPGADARQAYVRGAVLHARRGVPVASEPRAPVAGRGRVTGPYLIMAPTGASPGAPETGRPMADRLAPHLDRQAARSPEGDHAAGGNVLRAYQLERVRRLLARGAFEDGFAQLARALPHLPAEGRARVRAARGPFTRRPPPVVHDPDAFMRTPGDATREAASLLWATGDPDGALRLLELQAREADPRALLQLAWLHADAGRTDLARDVVQQFRHDAPDLAAEAEPLMSLLQGAPPP
ncbi:MAG: protein O-mannosyl-transferase family [Myxococcota bacterium]